MRPDSGAESPKPTRRPVKRRERSGERPVERERSGERAKGRQGAAGKKPRKGTVRGKARR
jgi:hypothetical protein